MPYTALPLEKSPQNWKPPVGLSIFVANFDQTFPILDNVFFATENHFDFLPQDCSFGEHKAEMKTTNAANACYCYLNKMKKIMSHRICTKPDLVLLLRMSGSTIDRRVRDARKGYCDFPIPISAPGQKMLWDAKSVEQWLANRANVAPPVNTPATKTEKQKSRDFAERQLRAQQALERHGLGRKGGTK